MVDINNANIIELKKVSKVYGKDIRTQVLFDIDLAFRQGSFNSIIGASGSGKSTIMNIMGTLDRPTSGEVRIGGENTTNMDKNSLAKLRNETIGFIFQFHYLLPEFSVMENVLMPYGIRKGGISKDARDRALELLDMMGLSSVAKNRATAISGGQQQRTAIARALINNPPLILADEPTGNLDSEATENTYRILRDVNKKFGATIVVITHDRHIAEMTDRIVEIKDGRVETDLAR